MALGPALCFSWGSLSYRTGILRKPENVPFFLVPWAAVRNRADPSNGADQRRAGGRPQGPSSAGRLLAGVEFLRKAEPPERLVQPHSQLQSGSIPGWRMTQARPWGAAGKSGKGFTSLTRSRKLLMNPIGMNLWGLTWRIRDPGDKQAEAVHQSRSKTRGREDRQKGAEKESGGIQGVLRQSDGLERAEPGARRGLQRATRGGLG